MLKTVQGKPNAIILQFITIWNASKTLFLFYARI